MIDLHSHVLPGVDDGAKDASEAAEMCRLAAADGCEAIVATPHQRHPYWRNLDRERLAATLGALRSAVGDRPRVLSGGEIYVDSDLLAAIDHFGDSGLWALAESHYLLLEFDRRDPYPEPAALVHEIAVAGWHPVLAHPELIPWLAEDLLLLDGLIERGALVQITAMSVTGAFGARPRMVVEKLLEHGMVHFLASDCHGVSTRRPGMTQAASAIAERWGEETAWRLTTANPQAVLEDRPVLVAA